MLWERYTGHARKAMLHAEDWAIRLRSPQISPEHILLGLLEEEGTSAVIALQRLGVDINQLRSELESQLKAQAPSQHPIGAPTLTPSSKQILLRAADEARSLGDEHIDTSHLLLSLLMEKRGLVAQTLAKHNVRYEGVRRICAEMKTEVKATGVEAKYTEDWTKLASARVFQKVGFWQKERTRFAVALNRRDKSNTLLLGNYETAFLLVQQFACDLAASENPLLRRPLLRLNWSKLQDEGDAKQLLRDVLKSEPKPVLFVGSVDDIVRWSYVILAAVQDQIVPVIAIAEPSQWSEFQKRYPAAASTFTVITVDEPNQEQTLEWLRVHLPEYQKSYKVTVEENAIAAIVSLTKERFPDAPLLATARNLLDEVCAYAKVGAKTTVNAEVVREYGLWLQGG